MNFIERDLSKCCGCAELADEENDRGNEEQGKPIRSARHHVLQQGMPLPDVSSGSCLYNANSAIGSSGRSGSEGCAFG